MKTSIYLDYAAATPVDPQVIIAMRPFWEDSFYNPSATYGAARDVAKQLATARKTVSHWLGSRSSEIIFTAGGTEANNLAIQGVMRQYPEANIVVSAVEHESVLVPAQQYDCREVGVQPGGIIDLRSLEAAIDDTTVLVSVMYANNEIGTIQPLREVAQIIASKRAARTNGLPLYFHSDACQAANYLDLHVARLGVDLLTLNGGKIYGPKQSGALYVGSRVQLTASVLGGGQERGLRSGTENVAQSVGFARALELAQTDRHDEATRLQTLQKAFIDQLREAMPAVIINGALKKRLPNNVHITVRGQDNERLLVQLDEAGIMATAGSACSASNEEPSHVLRALGCDDAAAQASLRFTMGRKTTLKDIKQTVHTLQQIIA